MTSRLLSAGRAWFSRISRGPSGTPCSVLRRWYTISGWRGVDGGVDERSRVPRCGLRGSVIEREEGGEVDDDGRDGHTEKTCNCDSGI